jgi:hypothetical protein
MGATVVSSSVSASNWSSQKPDGYDSSAFDKAIKTYEAHCGKGVGVTAIPAMPKPSIKEFEACIKTLEAVIADMKKGVTHFKELCDKAKAVSSAAGKCSGDLQKQAKDKSGAEKNKYLSAANAAAGIGDRAAAEGKKFE